MKSYEEFMKQFEMTTTQDVVGTGDNPDQTVIVRKKYDRKKKRKDMEKVLRRIFPQNFQKKS
jgi:hypothetical protein